jgi:integrase
MNDVRLFLDWAILTGRRKSKNPVESRILSPRRERNLPKPLSVRELREVDSLLEVRGDLRLKLAVAIGLEAGLQVGEVCDLQIDDIDLENQSIRVRRSNRTGVERTALFHVRTRKALEEWFAIRPHVDHGYLLTGNKGIPMRKHVLRSLVIRALCGPGKLKDFSFRRLAQTAAARLAGTMDTMGMMNYFGWQSPGPVEQIRRLPNKAAIAAYAEAMVQIADEPPELPSCQESLESFFGGGGGASASELHSPVF